jgi:hypothetical protein
MFPSKELIKSTLDFWGPKYAERGEILTEEDAREIIFNLTNFFDALAEIDRKHKEKVKQEVEAPKVVDKVKSNAEGRLVDVAEMSRILNVPPSWIYQRTHLGQKAIPHIKVGKYLRFEPHEVIKFFKNNQ